MTYRVFAVIFSLLVWASELAAQTWHYENDVRDYAYQFIENPPVPGCTLFAGSSSFRLWNNLEQTFAYYEAVNRGFGGSQFPDNLKAIERIHLPVSPARVVIFCGTNDIAGGADAETVFKNFKYYIARFWNEHPAAEIYYVSTTHAPSREKFWKTGDELFAKVQALAEKVNGLYCIDIRQAMLGEDGKVRKDLFVQDMLHLNEKGYAIWEKVFDEVLDTRRAAASLAEAYQSRKAAGLFDDPRFAEQGIAVKDYSQPRKTLAAVFIGDEITMNANIGEPEKNPVDQCGEYLLKNGYHCDIFNCGVKGFTTADFSPQRALLPKIKPAADLYKDNEEADLVFSIMLGSTETTEPEQYRRNLKAIVDKLLTEYPSAKIVLHRPIWADSIKRLPIDEYRLRAYYSEIKTLTDYYSQTSARNRVFLGDVNAFQYFQVHTGSVQSVEQRADILGRYWGAAILRAVR